MFNPQYRITHFFLKTCEKISTTTAAIKISTKNGPLQLQLEREFVSRSVHSSTRIEGNRLSFDQVLAIAANKNIMAQADQKQEVENCLNASKWVLEQRGKKLTEVKLLRLHKLITNGLVEKKDCGQYRHVQNYIVNARNQVIFTPPDPKNIHQRMQQLFLWLKNCSETHVIIKSAILHHEFVTIHPFVDGNGRVARLIGQWLLWSDEYEPLYTLGLDDFFAQDRARYYTMLQQARDLDDDYTYWIDYVVEGVLKSLNNLYERIRSVQCQGLHKISLTEKQKYLLQLLADQGEMGSADMCQHLQVNRARVNQLIKPLVDAGIVKKEGKTRGVRYYLP